MGSTFTNKDAKNTWKSLAKKLLKPHFRRPSATKSDTLEALTPSVSFGCEDKKKDFLKDSLKYGKGKQTE